MTRPYVNLKSKNKINDFMLSLQNNIKKFEDLEVVVGITLNGGNSLISLGITKIGKYLYDIKILNLNEEKQRLWDNVALWDLSLERLIKRQDVIKKLWEQIDLYIIKKECPHFKPRFMEKPFMTCLNY